jgi:tRNA dimethylallyltransferase
MAEQRIIVIGGPTASGKSAVALELARALGGAVINADSMQVYAELPVLTAQPDAAVRASVPHRLYGVVSARDICSAARWAEMAWRCIAETVGEGHLPIVVGGTGLYLRTLMGGIAPVPAIAPEARDRARALVRDLGPRAVHDRLARRDPATAARITPTDRQRLARAWEVLEATGRPLRDWQAEAPASGRPGYRFTAVVLAPERKALHAAIDGRFSRMVTVGALDEVRALDALSLPPDAPARKALGLRELAAHLAGRCSLADAVAAAQQATRRYAKRQDTWFRHQVPAANFIAYSEINETLMKSIASKIFPLIRHGG